MTSIGKRLSVDGEERTINEWGQLLGINPNVIRVRICRGEPPEIALRPAGTHGGVRPSVREAAEMRAKRAAAVKEELEAVASLAPLGQRVEALLLDIERRLKRNLPKYEAMLTDMNGRLR